MTRRGTLTGKKKAAVLLVSLGAERASEIYKHLKEEEIEQITLEIANLRGVDKEIRHEVLEEFYELCLAKNYISKGGIDYAKEILEKALGRERAVSLIQKLTSSLQVRPFDFARESNPSHLLNFIQSEHPQTIALIMSYLNPRQAAAILSELPMEKQHEVATRIATMDSTSPSVVREVERVLEKKLSSMVTSDFTTVGGIDSIVDILLSVDRGTEKNIVESLEIMDSELAEEIKKRMFVFEDIITLDDRSVQRFLREVDNSDLALALKNSSEGVSKTIFSNMSKRLEEMIREDMNYMGPVRLRDVEEAQQKIVNIIRSLEEAGEIIVSRGGDQVII